MLTAEKGNIWSMEDIPEQKTSNHVIRKFINSAIYVEKPLSDKISSEDISVRQKYSNENLLEGQNAKTKRCTCSVDQKSCPCHQNSSFVSLESKKSSATLNNKLSEPKIKVSHSRVIANNSDKDELIKNWLAKKEEEKKKRELKEKMKSEAKMKEREALLEQERRNFETWLMNKKRQEMEAKKKKQKEIEEKELRELEKQKRQLENELNFQLWLKKKEEAQLEKKIKQHINFINELGQKEKQMRENEKAFNEWLKNSKNKQKPTPLNKGLQTLCSSSSITYINPNPWNPVP